MAGEHPGMSAWLQRANVLLKDYNGYAMELTDTIQRATQRWAEREGRPVSEQREGPARQSQGHPLCF